MAFVGKTREQEWNGGLYVVRDVWANDPTGGPIKLLFCEYAVKSPSGKTVWKRCAEGVQFADIEPFEKVAA